MKIYTRTGDDGRTALFGAGRVDKGDDRVEALGALDELNATIGWLLPELAEERSRERLESVQHDLFALGAELATPSADEGGTRPHTPGLPDGRLEELERWIDEASEPLAPLRAFVLPGGVRSAAALHVGRTVCRRAERAVARLPRSEPSVGLALPYLNRLSDLLFTLARLENLRAGKGDVEWVKR